MYDPAQALRKVTCPVLALNVHLFQTSRTGQVAEYGEIEETIAPVALETMSGWILRHTQY